MATNRLHLTFPERLITEPVIYNVGKLFDVVTNIRRANVEEKVGWVILEVEGDDDEIVQATKYLEDLGVQVDPVRPEALEG